jgi:hypothetical protein
MLDKLPPLLALILISCAAPSAVERSAGASGAAAEIRYLSLDHARAMVFSGRTGRSGGIHALGPPNPMNRPPPYPVREFRTIDNAQCVSVGPPGNTDEYAVRRPMRAGDRYVCLGSTFEVTHCTENCRSAIIRVERSRAPDIGPLRSQMYVDSCRGLLILSDTGDLTQGVPLNAFLLRDPVGILADPDYPTCNWY